MGCSRVERSGRKQKAGLLAPDDFAFLAPAFSVEFATSVSNVSQQRVKSIADPSDPQYAQQQAQQPTSARRPLLPALTQLSAHGRHVGLRPGHGSCITTTSIHRSSPCRHPNEPCPVQRRPSRARPLPSCLKGKYLARVLRDEVNPFYHLTFTDGTQYKIQLEDYAPGKDLQLTSTQGFAENMEPFLDADDEGRRANPNLIEDCSFGLLKDKELRKRGLHRVTEHHGLALKIKVICSCVWGTFGMPDEQPDRWPGGTLHTPFLTLLNWRGKEIPRAEDKGEDVYDPERWR